MVVLKMIYKTTKKVIVNSYMAPKTTDSHNGANNNTLV